MRDTIKLHQNSVLRNDSTMKDMTGFSSDHFSFHYGNPTCTPFTANIIQMYIGTYIELHRDAMRISFPISQSPFDVFHYF